MKSAAAEAPRHGTASILEETRPLWEAEVAKVRICRERLDVATEGFSRAERILARRKAMSASCG